jgi:hypothetical protein
LELPDQHPRGGLRIFPDPVPAINAINKLVTVYTKFNDS